MRRSMIQLVTDEMHQRGLPVDLSHVTQFSTLVALAASRGPRVVTWPVDSKHPELPDGPFRLIRQRRGVVQLVMARDTDGRSAAPAERFVDTVDALVSRVGIEHVAVGFDDRPRDRAVADVATVVAALERRGYTRDEIDRLWHANLDRVHRETRGVVRVPATGDGPRGTPGAPRMVLKRG